MAVAWKVAGAFVLWLAGRWLIAFATRTLGRTLSRQQFDVTLTKLPADQVSVVLNIALIVAILGFFGVETTTFAALLAAGGVAIGVAWGGLLSNFAAGAFLVFLRPFKVGDFITAGWCYRRRLTRSACSARPSTLPTTCRPSSGTARSSPGRSRTSREPVSPRGPHRDDQRLRWITTRPSVCSRNGSANSERARDTGAGRRHPAVHGRRAAALRSSVLPEPHYWQVYFDTNRMIRESFGEAGFPAAVPRIRSPVSGRLRTIRLARG